MKNIGCTIVIVLYFAMIIYLTFRGTHRKTEGSFSEDFYVGGRKIGPVALAILIAAGACSTGTFVGGPGLAGAYGLGFILVFVGSQICITLNILGIMGKKMNIIGRRTHAESYIDIFRYRYNNWKPLIFVLSIAIIVFLVTSAAAEFIGGSRVIETVTGIPYVGSIIAFGTIITLYTATGGLKGVSLVGIVQGFIMTAATIILVIGYMIALGGMPQIVQTLNAIDPNLLSPTSGGAFDFGYLIDKQFTYSIGCIGLPWAVQSALTYKDTKTMKTAIVTGTAMVMIWTILLSSWGGAAARAYAPDLMATTSSDYFIPNLALGVLPNILAGVVLAGVAGAGQSTIAALFILAASTIVINIYHAYINPEADDATLKKMSMTVCAVVGIVCVILALTNPPTLQIFITFATGGCAASLIPGMVMGLYWPRCNRYGAFAAAVSGLGLYAFFTVVDIGIPLTLKAPFLFTFPVSIFLCYFVSKMTQPESKETIQIYFGEMEGPIE